MMMCVGPAAAAWPRLSSRAFIRVRRPPPLVPVCGFSPDNGCTKMSQFAMAASAPPAKTTSTRPERSTASRSWRQIRRTAGDWDMYGLVVALPFDGEAAPMYIFEGGPTTRCLAVPVPRLLL